MPVYFRTPSQRKIRKMTARQRKKFHLGEFARLDFGVAGNLLPQHHTSEYFDHFMDELIDFVEQNSMCLGGGGCGADFSFIVEHEKQPPLNITAEQKALLINWLAARPDVEHLRAGAIIDGFYADEAMFEQYDEIYK